LRGLRNRALLFWRLQATPRSHSSPSLVSPYLLAPEDERRLAAAATARMPALIARAGGKRRFRFLELFTASIRDKNACRAEFNRSRLSRVMGPMGAAVSFNSEDGRMQATGQVTPEMMQDAVAARPFALRGGGSLPFGHERLPDLLKLTRRASRFVHFGPRCHWGTRKAARRPPIPIGFDQRRAAGPGRIEGHAGRIAADSMTSVRLSADRCKTQCRYQLSISKR